MNTMPHARCALRRKSPVVRVLAPMLLVASCAVRQFIPFRNDQRDPVISVEPTDKMYQDTWNSNGPGDSDAPIVIEKYKLIFFPVPKVACTSWKLMFRRMMGYDDRRAGLHDPEKNGLRYLYQYEITRATEFMNSPEYTRAIFVRDPKDRVLSAFLNKVINQKDYLPKIFSKNTCCSSDDADCIERLHSFSGFIDAIDKCEKNCCHDQHWTPWSRRIDDKIYTKLDFVGHLENAEEDAKRLLQRIGAWEEYGATGWGESGNEPFMHSNSAFKFSRTNAGNNRTQYFTPELERLVETLYSGDYSKFNLPLNRVKYDD